MDQLRRGVVVLVAALLCGCGGGGGGGGGAPPASPTTWTVMVYISADNNLEAFAPFNINQMESAPGAAHMNVIVEVDTKTIPINGSATAKRLRIQPDANPGTVTSPTLSDLGEIDTASASELADFVEFATTSFPANRYVLILWDHGGQYVGYGSDDTTCGCDGGPPINYSGLKNALATIESTTGIASFDVIGFDACLMGALEIQRLCRDHAGLVVASAELEPGAGWDYETFLGAIAGNSGISPADLGQVISDGFLAQCTLNDEQNVTMSVLNASAANPVLTALDGFAVELRAALGVEANLIATARRSSTEYGRQSPNEPASYVDVRQFAAQVAADTAIGTLATAATAFVSALDAAVLYRVQGALKPNHRGASIYFPDCNACLDASYFNDVDLALETEWDDFLLDFTSALGGDLTAPVVTIDGVSSTTVSSASPVTIDFTVTAPDLHGVRVDIATQVDPSSWLFLAEIDLDIDVQGSYSVEWDGRLFQINDGSVANYLPASVVDPSVNLHAAYVAHLPVGGGPVNTLIMFVVLDYVTESSSLVGFYQYTPSGSVAEVSVGPGDLINVLLPVYDTAIDAFVYQYSAADLTVPIGGLTIASFDLAAGNYDVILLAEDNAGNRGGDIVILTVP